MQKARQSHLHNKHWHNKKEWNGTEDKSGRDGFTADVDDLQLPWNRARQ